MIAVQSQSNAKLTSFCDIQAAFLTLKFVLQDLLASISYDTQFPRF